MGSKNIFYLISLFIFTLSFLRLFEGIVKRELKSEWQDWKREYSLIFAQSESLKEKIREKEGERTLFSLLRELTTQKEPYLTINRRTMTAQLKMEDKSLRTMTFSIKGRRAIAGEMILPKGILEIKEKIKETSLFIPDWVYELLGQEIPQDTSIRKINHALGRYSLSLGADICLTGRVKEELPEGILELICLEFTDEDIEAIYNTLKENSLVLFF